MGTEKRQALQKEREMGTEMREALQKEREMGPEKGEETEVRIRGDEYQHGKMERKLLAISFYFLPLAG